MIGLHMLHPLQGAAQQQAPFASSSSAATKQVSGQYRECNQPHIVRIAAKTASPIVSSVPKCRSAKSSRLHPIDTVNGSAVSLSSGRASEKVRANAHQNLANIKQADQVLLIVNDDHIKGGGVPIIGRRLPSKSMAMRNAAYAQQAVQNEPEHGARDYSMPPTIQVESAMPIKAPVVGRRSHRLIQQQQHQQVPRLSAVYHTYEDQLIRQKSSCKSTGSKYDSQQPLSIIETQLATSQQVHLQQHAQLSSSSRSGRQNQKPMKYQSVSIMNIAEPLAEYNLTPMQQISGIQNYLQAGQNLSRSRPKSSTRSQSKQTSRGSEGLAGVPSSSCSSLCTANGPQQNDLGLALKSQLNYPSCCSPCPSSPDPVLGTCREPCCQFEHSYDEGTCNEPSCNILASRSPSFQRVPSCCIAPPVGQKAHSSKQLISHLPTVCSKGYSHHHHHHHQRQSQHHHHTGSQASRHLVRAPNSHHHSCQANTSAANVKSSTATQLSSPHDSRRQSQHNQPMLISGRNILPVHPKPNIKYSLIASNEQQGYCGGQVEGAAVRGMPVCEEATAVTQMYESLAAELKAKLGDPKMGPILLPPKDYDTMSRKQGRLTGIELRRSTNPQLVGPAANRLNATTSHPMNSEGTINEEQVVNNAKSPITTDSPTGSARSSGRSQDDRSSQRSRSNSSSGLGSISMGPSSPNSPPTSSSEDMRQKVSSTRVDDKLINRHHHHHHIGLIDRKNNSPDNCNSSDSGHSGSGRLDSALSSEETKIMLRDTATDEYLKSSPLSSAATTDSKSSVRINSETVDVESGAKSKTTTTKISDKAVGPSSEVTTREESRRGKGIHNHNPAKVSDGSLWNGRVEVPLKVNSSKNGDTYLATKQIIY